MDADTILTHIDALRAEAPPLTRVRVARLLDLVVPGTYPGIDEDALRDLIATKAAALGFEHPEYLQLAGRARVALIRSKTPPRFSEAVALLRAATDSTGAPAPLVASGLADFVRDHAARVDAAVDGARACEFGLTYFAMQTLERAYLLKLPDGTFVERPSYMWMRVALGTSTRTGAVCWETAARVFALLSARWFTFATPTLFNAGTPRPQCSSCFLLPVASDSIEGMFSTVAQCAQISKHAGGIGISCSNVRATGSYIRGTGGSSNGLVPMLRVFNATARLCDQGGGKRKGAFAVYLEPWHPDIFDFLNVRKNQGVEELRCRDLFTALWIPDVFMERVRDGGAWHLICPDTAPDLVDLHGAAFRRRYAELAADPSKVRRTVRARDVWHAILDSQLETGTPYLCYKDAANAKSNQSNLGTIRSSNLCTEVMQYSSADETAVCNLASLVLPAYVADGRFDYARLGEVTRTVVRALDRVIDLNYYPHPNARRSNLRHRPIGLGIQGLADVFMACGLAFASAEAVAMGARIMETVYHAAVRASCELARELGPYATFAGSPASEGRLQFDLWGVADDVYAAGHVGRAAWDRVRADVRRHGLRNSLLVAPMPTASTSQICGSVCESFEPLRGSVSTRRTIAGEFTVVNPYLVRDLERTVGWTESVRNLLARDRGSAQRLPGLTAEQRERYRTAWEMSQKWVIDHAAARAPFVCQSQSLNLYANDAMLQAGHQKVSAMQFYAWRRGLKTGCYYLRSNPPDPTLQFTVDVEAAERACVSCGS